MAHITGGGLPENLPRCLGQGQSIAVKARSWVVPPVFDWLAAQGAVAPLEMFNTFNMGIGFVVIVPAEQADRTIQWFEAQDLPAWAIGQVIAGSGELIFSNL
jgi:phosphoribosylformylglycinamidine cyclo-ligase